MRDFERDADNRIVCDDNPGAWLANAMRRPANFGYFGDNPDMFVTWSLGPVIEHRDSGLIDRSNAEALRKFLASDPSLEDEYVIDSANHWAVGHVTHCSFHAYDSDDDRTKRPTRIARILAAWFTYLADEYPIADDGLHSEMETEQSWKWIGEEGTRFARRHDYTLPDEWQDKVMTWWDSHRSSALEDVDDQGASPSDDDFRAAFDALGFTHEED